MVMIEVLVIFSSLSFLGYGIAYFISPRMKSEFIRFGLKKFGILTAVLEILGGLGLLVGLKFNSLLMISSGGLALLMFFGVLARIRVKDGLWVLLPALFFLFLNSYIFYNSMNIFFE